MDEKSNYLVLDEERNAVDYLMRSIEFFERIDENRLYLKWFAIAFHGAIYTFILLVLNKFNSEQIYKGNKIKTHSLDRDLISFLSAFALLKKVDFVGKEPFTFTQQHDACMTELNNKIRNQMMHFRPVVWAIEPWYPARACYPLISILKLCTENYQFIHNEKTTILSSLDKLEELLNSRREE